MKAILTRYLGPTDRRGSRIVAFDCDGNRATIPYPYELSGSDCHYKAAKALLEKMGWKVKVTGEGGIKGGYAFTFA